MQKKIEVLFEDDFFIAFYKPAGLLVIPTPQKEKRTLTSIVKKQVGASLYPCHRLDRETSGVILFAKDKKSQQRLTEEFKKRKVRKIYIAFVRGKLKKKGGRINIPILDYHQRKHQKHCRPKPALTHYKVLANKRKFSIVEVSPQTGRTNQIRIHFSKLGHPLLGERVYAYRKDFDIHFRRVALHAQLIEFHHPFLKRKIRIQANLALDMEKLLERYK